MKHLKANDTFLSFFDVKSLFTKLPLNEVITVCADALYSLENPIHKRNNFILLMKLATEEVEFSFNNILYCQVDGIAMGSPLANIFMSYLEYKILPDFNLSCKYFRYVDEIELITQRH